MKKAVPNPGHHAAKLDPDFGIGRMLDSELREDALTKPTEIFDILKVGSFV